MEAIISSPFLWCLETLTKEKLKESYGTTRDASIIAELHTWVRLEVKDELLQLGVRMNMRVDP